MKRADVLCIGGGMMGLSTALHLARDGKKVIVVEREFSGKHASGVNAGGLRSLKRDNSELAFIHGALEMWHSMEKIVGSDCGFCPTGYLIAAEDDAAMNELEARVNYTRSLGYTNEIAIDKKELRRIAPIVREHCVGGIKSEIDGHANPVKTCHAFAQAAVREGVTLYSGCGVKSVVRSENGFHVETDSGGTLYAEQVVNCSGAWAGEIARSMGEELSVRPVGASVMVTARMPILIKYFISVQGRKLWFNQAPNGSLLICGGYLSHVDMEKRLTSMNFHTLRECAKVAHDLFAVARKLTIVRSWAGLDGETPDHFPIIGYSRRVPGLFHLCGFSRHGFALSPMVGKTVAALLQGKEAPVPISGFEPDRFG